MSIIYQADYRLTLYNCSLLLLCCEFQSSDALLKGVAKIKYDLHSLTKMVSKNHKAVIDMLATRSASMPQIQELEFTTKMPVETEEEFDLLEDELKQSYEKRKFLVKKHL